MTGEVLTLEGTLELPRVLHLLGAQLGRAYAVRIGGVDCMLCMPTVPPWKWPEHLPQLAAPESFRARYRIDWGSVRGMPGAWSAIQHVVIRLEQACMGEPPDALAERLAAGIRDGLSSWLFGLYEWLSALTQQAAYGWESTERTRFSEHTVGFTWTTDGKTQNEASHGVISVNLGKLEPATEMQWVTALSRTSAGTALPLEHVLMNGARHAFAKAEWRRAAIDAGTASEIALANMVKLALASQSTPSVAAYVLKKARGIMELVRVAQSVGVQLPPNIRTEIADPRNRAAHEGASLSAIEATAAISLSEKVVWQASPLI